MAKTLSRRSFVGLTAGAGAALLLAACGGSQASPSSGAPASSTSGSSAPASAAQSPKKGGTLVVGLADAVATLDNSVGTGAQTAIVQGHMFEGLLQFDLTTNADVPPLKPRLAESYDVSKDGIVYTFKLRKGVKFHDGTPFNADAVKFNHDRITDPKHPFFFDKGKGTAASVTRYIKSTDVVDEYTYRINMVEPHPNFPAKLDTLSVSIGSPAAIQKYGNNEYGNHPTGTGPFKFVSRDGNGRVTVERNPDYWNQAQPYLDKIIFSSIQDPSARVIALQKGEVDFIETIAPDQIESLKKDPKLTVVMEPCAFTWVVNVNHKEKPFSDVRVRQAVSYAINRDAIGKEILQGSATPADQLQVPGAIGYNASLKGYPFDPAKAKQLLADAGYPNGFETTFDLPTAGSSFIEPVKMAEYMQKNLADIGVKVKLQTQDWTSYVPYFFKGIPAGKGMYLMNNTSLDGDDIEKLNSVVFQPPNGFNAGWYKNDDVEKLLKQAGSNPDPKQSADQYQQIEKMINDDVAMIYLLHPNPPRAYNASLQGWVNPHSQYYNFFNAWKA